MEDIDRRGQFNSFLVAQGVSEYQMVGLSRRLRFRRRLAIGGDSAGPNLRLEPESADRYDS